MHQDETLLCPFPERKQEVLRLAGLCSTRLGPEEKVRTLALDFQARTRLSANDAIHLACAIHAGARFFVTCDDRLLRRAEELKLSIIIENPIDYVRRTTDLEASI